MESVFLFFREVAVLNHRNIMFLLAVVIVSAFFLELILHIIIQEQVNYQLGFRYDTPYRVEGEVFVITKIAPGKAMDLAGLKKGDYIRFHSVDTLYSLLIEHQGQDVAIPVQRGSQYLDISLNDRCSSFLNPTMFFGLKKNMSQENKLFIGAYN